MNQGRTQVGLVGIGEVVGATGTKGEGGIAGREVRVRVGTSM